MTLAANMLVGKFAEPWLLASLRSINWVDEIIIVANNMHPINQKQVMQFSIEYDNLVVLDYFKAYKDFRFDYARNLAKNVTDTDYILKIDADEVYYDSFKNAFYNIDRTVDYWRVYFYHFYFDDKHLQEIHSADVLFKNNKDWSWQKPVHEVMEGPDKHGVLDVYYAHYGYVKPQREVFNKWWLYAELDNNTEIYKDTDPDHILDEAKTKPFDGPYPEVFERFNFEYIVSR